LGAAPSPRGMDVFCGARGMLGFTLSTAGRTGVGLETGCAAGTGVFPVATGLGCGGRGAGRGAAAADGFGVPAVGLALLNGGPPTCGGRGMLRTGVVGCATSEAAFLPGVAGLELASGDGRPPGRGTGRGVGVLPAPGVLLAAGDAGLPDWLGGAGF